MVYLTEYKYTKEKGNLMKTYKELFEATKNLSGSYGPRTMLGKKILKAFTKYVSKLKLPSEKEISNEWKSWSKGEGAAIVRTYVLSKVKDKESIAYIGFTGPGKKWTQHYNRGTKVAHKLASDFRVFVQLKDGFSKSIKDFAKNNIIDNPDTIIGKKTAGTTTFELNDNNFIIVFS